MVDVLLCRVNQGQMLTHRVSTPHDQAVKDLVHAAAMFAKVPSSQVVLTHQGTQLSPSSTLDQYNLRSGSLVMVTVIPPKPTPQPVTNTTKVLTPEEIQRFTLALGSAFKHPAFTKVVKRLLQPENMESLAAACPGLSTDMIAQGFLTRPELLLHLLEPDTLTKVSSSHPCILEAAHNIAAAVHEEQAGSREQEQPAASGGGSYYLDEMSDDDMEGDEPGQGRGSAAARPSFNAITPAQLAQALSVAARGSQGGFQGVTGLGAGGTRGGPPGGSSGTSPSARITTDMFQAAMMQALSGMGGGQQQQTGGEPDYSEQVGRMREMGIIDEGLAVRALQLNGGDLQAAVNLILSGWDGGDDAMQ